MQLVLDIETRRFTDSFQRAKRIDQRRRLAPEPLLACIFLIEKRRYLFFTGRSLRDVVPILESADTVVTFNGDRFDFLVLERWCGWRRPPGFDDRSVDLCRVVADHPFALIGKPRVRGGTLDRVGKLNLGVARVDSGTIKERCRAHVRLTHRLYQKWRAGRLIFPVRPEANLLQRCPECGKVAELVPFQPDYEGMTEGQVFDYEMGHQVGGWGFARCTARRCKKLFAWGI